MIFSIAVFAPLIGALIAGLPGRYMGDRAARLVAILFMLLASVCGVTVWVQYGAARAISLCPSPPG
jgi:NADH-quinone oxidoreductase subunit L